MKVKYEYPILQIGRTNLWMCPNGFKFKGNDLPLSFNNNYHIDILKVEFNNKESSFYFRMVILCISLGFNYRYKLKEQRFYNDNVHFE